MTRFFSFPGVRPPPLRHLPSLPVRPRDTSRCVCSLGACRYCYRGVSSPRVPDGWSCICFVAVDAEGCAQSFLLRQAGTPHSSESAPQGCGTGHAVARPVCPQTRPLVIPQQEQNGPLCPRRATRPRALRVPAHQPALDGSPQDFVALCYVALKQLHSLFLPGGSVSCFHTSPPGSL